MSLGHVNRKIRAFGGDDEPKGNHVILRVPNPIRTAAQKRDCHVTGLQFGRIIRRAKNPLKIDVYREKGYWVHELAEFRIWAADPDFKTSREDFRNHLLHIYQQAMTFTRGKATRDAMELKKRLQDLFPIEELVA